MLWVGGPGKGASLSRSGLQFGVGDGTEAHDGVNSPDAGPTTHMQCDLLWVAAKVDVSCQVTESLLGSWWSLAGAPHTKGVKSGVGTNPGDRGRLAFLESSAPIGSRLGLPHRPFQSGTQLLITPNLLLSPPWGEGRVFRTSSLPQRMSPPGGKLEAHRF